MAKADFQSLSGISYDRYCNDKYERCHNDKYEWNSPKIGSNTLSVLVNKSDIQGIDDDFRRLLIALDKAGKIKLSPKERKENTSDIIEKIVGKIRDYHKIDKFCKLTVDDRGNIFYSQGSKQIKCRFERYRLSRVIYILFLRQIERAAADTSGKTPKSICVTYLNEYEDELFAIYEAMEPSGNKKSHSGSIKVLCEDSSNERSKINTFFNDTFNLDEIEKNNNGKHYTIKIVDKDPKSGLSLYAVGLDIDDFDLGLFSIDKLRV